MATQTIYSFLFLVQTPLRRRDQTKMWIATNIEAAARPAYIRSNWQNGRLPRPHIKYTLSQRIVHGQRERESAGWERERATAAYTLALFFSLSLSLPLWAFALSKLGLAGAALSRAAAAAGVDCAAAAHWFAVRYHKSVSKTMCNFLGNCLLSVCVCVCVFQNGA